MQIARASISRQTLNPSSWPYVYNKYNNTVQRTSMNDDIFKEKESRLLMPLLHANIQGLLFVMKLVICHLRNIGEVSLSFFFYRVSY